MTMETPGQGVRSQVVRCPACASRYRVPADDITFVGAQIWCASCAHTFLVYPDEVVGGADEDVGRSPDGAGEISPLALPPAMIEVGSHMQVPDSRPPAPSRVGPPAAFHRDMDATLSLERPLTLPPERPGQEPAARPAFDPRPLLAAAMGLFLVASIAGVAWLVFGGGPPAADVPDTTIRQPIQVEAPSAPAPSAAPAPAPAVLPAPRAPRVAPVPAPAVPAPGVGVGAGDAPVDDGLPRPEIGRQR
jgi:predicted Zn finger-like uncharacterized protein